MESVYLLIPLSLLFVVVAVWVLFRALRQGQFDDLERPGWQVVFDDLDEPQSRHARELEHQVRPAEAPTSRD